MIKPIHNKKEYRAMLVRIEELWDAEPGTTDHDELEVLSIIVDKYEEAAFPIDMPDPVDALLFYIEQNDLEKADLGRVLGSRSRASEILNRHRDLSLSQVRVIKKEWGISADILTEPVRQ